MKKTTVINSEGTSIDFDAAVNMMDDDLREKVHHAVMYEYGCGLSAQEFAQKFFTVYCIAHRSFFGEEFEPNKANPVW